MNRKKYLLMLSMIIALFIGIINVKAVEYKLTSKSSNPITCEYKMIDNDSIKLSLVYENDTFSILYMGISKMDGEVKIEELKSKNGCPEKIEVSSDSPAFLTVSPKYSKVHCGSDVGMVKGIPKKIPELTSLAVTIIQIAVPIILILMGSIDLFKGITAGKEDEMKKGQQMFIKRLVSGAIIFFVVILVKFIISIVADTNTSNIVSCIDCFVDNECVEGYE